MSLLTELTRAMTGSIGRVDTARLAPVSGGDLAEREGAFGDTPAIMRSVAWTLPAVPWLRMACLDANERARVFSVLALPDLSRVLPMFGAEVVEIRGRITVIAIDWMPVGEETRDCGSLAKIRVEFEDFPPGGELPPWAAASFSPFALYSRPHGQIERHRVVRAFRTYLEGYLAKCVVAPVRDDSGSAKSEIHAYCIEHFEHDPGGRMLTAAFGKQWVDRYAREFLFRL